MAELRILVTGSRGWTDVDTIIQTMHETAALYPNRRPVTLVHGAARGADQIAAGVAAMWGWQREPHPADWTRWGKRAGYLRNKEMIELGADFCLAFILDDSPGASMCARLAQEAYIPTLMVKTFSTEVGPGVSDVPPSVGDNLPATPGRDHTYDEWHGDDQ